MSVLCSTSSISPRVKAKVLKMSSLGFPVQPSPMHSLCSSLTGLLSRLPRGLCTSFSLWLKGSLPFCHFRSQLKKWALQREQPGNPVQLCLKPSNISCPPALLHLPWGPLFLSDLLSVLPTFFFYYQYSSAALSPLHPHPTHSSVSPLRAENFMFTVVPLTLEECLAYSKPLMSVLSCSIVS